jgi:hypothetical protein
MFAFAVIFALTAVYFDDKKKTSTSRQWLMPIYVIKDDIEITLAALHREVTAMKI